MDVFQCVCAGLWKQTACLCSVSSRVSSQIHFFFPSLCLFDLWALQPWAELDFSKAQPGFCHLWLVLWPFSVAQEVKDLSPSGVWGKNRDAASLSVLPTDWLSVDMTAVWGKQSRPLARGLAKDGTDNVLDCAKRWFIAHKKKHVSDTRMCAQMNAHAEANHRTVATGVLQLLTAQHKRLVCLRACSGSIPADSVGRKRLSAEYLSAETSALSSSSSHASCCPLGADSSPPSTPCPSSLSLDCTFFPLIFLTGPAECNLWHCCLVWLCFGPWLGFSTRL